MDLRDELGKIREREIRATEGPWAPWLDQDGAPHMQGLLMVGNAEAVMPEGEVYIEGVDVNPIAHTYTPEDREFIAHARTDVPRLVEAVGAVADLRDRIAGSPFEALTKDSMVRSLDAALHTITGALDPEAPDAAQDAQNRAQSGRAEGAEGGGGSGGSWGPQTGAETLRNDCPCAACDPGLHLAGDNPFWFPAHMSVCPDCGNKRCPKAANHARWQCSGSNEPGQVGVPVEHEHRWVSSRTLGDRGGFEIQSCTTCTATREEPS